MQWLINIVKERLRDQLGFFDRGDPATPDLTKANLGLAGVWHDWDLSAIVPVGTKAVLLRLALTGIDSASIIRFRKKGHTGWPNVAVAYIDQPELRRSSDKVIAVSDDRKIQYYWSPPGFTAANITIAAWWLR